MATPGQNIFRYYGNVLSIAQSGPTSDGYLSAADWLRFNAGREAQPTLSAIGAIPNGQNFVDITFPIEQATANWKILALNVFNSTDPNPLNLATGTITNRTTIGFRVWLSGNTDSGNYFLMWGIADSNPASGVATTYLLDAPSGGIVGIASANFTVSIALGQSLPAPVTITPSDNSYLGTFTPASVVLSETIRSATFTYTAAVGGAIPISFTNTGSLHDPSPITFTALTVATTYTLTGPSSGFKGVASSNFTVALPAGSTLLAPVTITPNDAGGGGSFSPTSVILSAAQTSATFTYTAASVGAKSIHTTNGGGLTDPSPITYTAAFLQHLLNTLISYWKLDESSGTRVDSIGTNNLAPVNAPGSAAGKINNGAAFVRASSQGLQIADNTDLRVTSDFTFSLWVKLTAHAALTYILAKVGAPGATDYIFVYDPGGNGFEAAVGTASGGTQFAIMGSTVADNVWTHIVLWFDATGDAQIHFRINDTTTFSSSTSPGLVQSASPFFIGGGNTLFSDSVIDETGFWKRKLTADEKSALYNGGAALPLSSFLP